MAEPLYSIARLARYMEERIPAGTWPTLAETLRLVDEYYGVGVREGAEGRIIDATRAGE